MNINPEKLTSNGDRWSVFPSRNHPGKFYYFNFSTGQSLWNQDEVDGNINRTSLTYRVPNSASALNNSSTQTASFPNNTFLSSSYNCIRCSQNDTQLFKMPNDSTIIQTCNQPLFILLPNVPDNNQATNNLFVTLSQKFNPNKVYSIGKATEKSTQTDSQDASNKRHIVDATFARKRSKSVQTDVSNYEETPKGGIKTISDISKVDWESQSVQAKGVAYGNLSNLDKDDLRLKLIAKRRKCLNLGEDGRKMQDRKVTETPKKRVTFDLEASEEFEDISSITNDDDVHTQPDQEPYKDESSVKKPYNSYKLSDLFMSEWSTDPWYIVVDLEMMLDHFAFLDKAVRMDPKCRIMIPKSVHEKLKSVSFGDSRERPTALKARHVLRQVSQNKYFIVQENIHVFDTENKIINCCRQVIQDGHQALLLTNDLDLQEKAKILEVPTFTTKDFHQYLAMDEAKYMSMENIKIIIKTSPVDNNNVSNDQIGDDIPVTSNSFMDIITNIDVNTNYMHGTPLSPVIKQNIEFIPDNVESNNRTIEATAKDVSFDNAINKNISINEKENAKNVVINSGIIKKDESIEKKNLKNLVISAGIIKRDVSINDEENPKNLVINAGIIKKDVSINEKENPKNLVINAGIIKKDVSINEKENPKNLVINAGIIKKNVSINEKENPKNLVINAGIIKKDVSINEKENPKNLVINAGIIKKDVSINEKENPKNLVINAGIIKKNVSINEKENTKNLVINAGIIKKDVSINEKENPKNLVINAGIIIPVSYEDFKSNTEEIVSELKEFCMKNEGRFSNGLWNQNFLNFYFKFMTELLENLLWDKAEIRVDCSSYPWFLHKATDVIKQCFNFGTKIRIVLEKLSDVAYRYSRELEAAFLEIQTDHMIYMYYSLLGGVLFLVCGALKILSPTRIKEKNRSDWDGPNDTSKVSVTQLIGLGDLLIRYIKDEEMSQYVLDAERAMLSLLELSSVTIPYRTNDVAANENCLKSIKGVDLNESERLESSPNVTILRNELIRNKSVTPEIKVIRTSGKGLRQYRINRSNSLIKDSQIDKKIDTSLEIDPSCNNLLDKDLELSEISSINSERSELNDSISSEEYLYVVTTFLAEIKRFFLLIHYNVNIIIAGFQTGKTDSGLREKRHRKMIRAQKHIIKLIDMLQRILERESSGADYTVKVVFKNTKIKDVKIIRYSQVITKCLEQAELLQEAIQIGLHLTKDEIDIEFVKNLAISSATYYNIFEDDLSNIYTCQ